MCHIANYKYENARIHKLIQTFFSREYLKYLEKTKQLANKLCLICSWYIGLCFSKTLPNSIVEENFRGENSQDKSYTTDIHLAFQIIPKRNFSLALFLSSKCSVVLQCHHLPSPDVTFDLFLLPLLKGGKHAILCCREDAAYYVIHNACINAYSFMRFNSTCFYITYTSGVKSFECL